MREKNPRPERAECAKTKEVASVTGERREGDGGREILGRERLERERRERERLDREIL